MSIFDNFKFYWNSGRVARHRWNERKYERRQYHMAETEEYYEAFAKQLAKIWKGELEAGNIVGIIKRANAKTFIDNVKNHDFAVTMGRKFDKQLKEMNSPNYEMIKFMAEQDVETKCNTTP